ncbi:MAG: 3-methyl-2-oxobutanoate dehydrogenase subunit VorB [Candidatus Omnitrophica bacterium CG07_land_8_20_14_0_80_42_15]|uniref:3-methyl-2-oxobutanoate dehydrogenase subunit VorB n=1 Tax=Candidatus Aquitaenariimonas noxiae TaxID=1974741 RepID=A0A2J0KS87_9BACT|nr:MAG: 3-methyl-2-oxobutanoate dehydrogenase subunit VorB [Candidatus Omnitrophica bacterium CG07_land_8_20_14_0_80_42_15]
MSKVVKRILITGNEACAEGAIRAGCRFYAGYPITPQNELIGYMSKRMREAGGTFIQAESELAAINMVFGAAAAGERAMTSSSGPGISLKQEGISYLSGCELPAVVVNVMRGGPGLGNIAPSQSDYFQATRGGGHGDYRTIVLAPASVEEFATFAFDAFDLADKYRIVTLVLTDGALGQMMEPVPGSLFSDMKPAKRQSKKGWILDGCRGRKARSIKSLFLKDGELEELNKKLQRKYEEISKKEVRCEVLYEKDSEIFLIAYGIVARIVKSCVEKMRKNGLKVGVIRPITLWPFPNDIISKAVSKAKSMLVVEMSEGQMVEDVRLAVGDKCKVRFYGRSGGNIPTEDEITKILIDSRRGK